MIDFTEDNLHHSLAASAAPAGHISQFPAGQLSATAP